MRPRATPWWRQCAASGGYDCTATTNRARFQARERRTDGPPLRVEGEDWFRAYLEALGLPEERSPLPVRLSYEQGNAVTVEHRPERVVLRVRKGPTPSLALEARLRQPLEIEYVDQHCADDTLRHLARRGLVR